MADSKDDLWGCLGIAAAGAGFLWLVTAPASDQVCRNRDLGFVDALHGTDGQPTCQQLFDQLDAQAAEARRHDADLESRLSDVESKLNM